MQCPKYYSVVQRTCIYNTTNWKFTLLFLFCRTFISNNKTAHQALMQAFNPCRKWLLSQWQHWTHTAFCVGCHTKQSGLACQDDIMPLPAMSPQVQLKCAGAQNKQYVSLIFIHQMDIKYATSTWSSTFMYMYIPSFGSKCGTVYRCPILCGSTMDWFSTIFVANKLHYYVKLWFIVNKLYL